MDCDLARLFLQFTRPEGDDLAGPEAAELRAHLEQCSSCNALAMNARRLDHHLGRAMNAVPLPAGLKSRLVGRLAEERSIFRRKWVRRIASVAAVAACLLIAIWSYAWWDTARTQAISLAEVQTAASVSGYDQRTTNDALKRLGARPAAPRFVDYAYMSQPPALAELPGYRTKVPRLVFTQKTPAGQQEVIVYAVPGSIRDTAPPLGSGYRYELDIKREGGYSYVILYTGPNWNWLDAKDE